MVQETLHVIQKRWPKVAKRLENEKPTRDVHLVQVGDELSLRVNGLLIGSAYNRVHEARLQASLVPALAEEATVYGIGLGDLPRALLERPCIRKLQVVCLSLALLRTVFEHFDQSDWLKDPRVELLLPDMSTISFPMAAVPSELSMVSSEAEALKDRVLLELDTPYIRERHFDQSGEIAQRIQSNAGRVARDGDAASFFGRWKGQRVFVAAAGPTLEQTSQMLAVHHRGEPVVVVDAGLKPLLAAGVTPNLVISIDDKREGVLSFFLGVDLEALRAVPLVYFPRLHPDVIDLWEGPKLVAYAEHSHYQEIEARYPRARLFSSGSVIHPAVDLAVKAGAAEIVLMGTDFSFPGNRFRAGAHLLQEERVRHFVSNGYGQAVGTMPNFRGYLRDLETYISCHPEVRFYNSSRDGAAIAGTEFWEFAR